MVCSASLFQCFVLTLFKVEICPLTIWGRHQGTGAGVIADMLSMLVKTLQFCPWQMDFSGLSSLSLLLSCLSWTIHYQFRDLTEKEKKCSFYVLHWLNVQVGSCTWGDRKLGVRGLWPPKLEQDTFSVFHSIGFTVCDKVWANPQMGQNAVQHATSDTMLTSQMFSPWCNCHCISSMLLMLWCNGTKP